jgi:hypothetical protein
MFVLFFLVSISLSLTLVILFSSVRKGKDDAGGVKEAPRRRKLPLPVR